MIAHARLLGGCSVTIAYGKQVEYQCEAGYHVETERESASKPEGCHAKESAEPEQPVQATEQPVGAVSSCGHVASLDATKLSQWAVLDHGPSRHRVRRMACVSNRQTCQGNLPGV